MESKTASSKSQNLGVGCHSGFRCQEKETWKLQPVEDPVCREAAEGNTETIFIKGQKL